jgi:hypothetical protein
MNKIKAFIKEYLSNFGDFHLYSQLVQRQRSQGSWLQNSWEESL